jgi:phosphoribosyl-ATP pyrophosphohydrolase/phosphoribosyl-AMP cyclohydrolase
MGAPMNVDDLRWDGQGLIPAIVQDADTGDVLMLAYMNRDSLQRTLESGETWFWSRSRQELWHKGATSGNVQHVVEVRYDCDADALLVRVTPAGPACHTGARSCFYRTLPYAGQLPDVSHDEQVNEYVQHRSPGEQAIIRALI